MSIPNSRIPFMYVDFNNSKAITPDANQEYHVLLIGRHGGGGKSALDTLQVITSEDDAKKQFGDDSQLHRMSIAYFKNCKSVKTYAVAVEKDLTNMIKNLADKQFHLICNSFLDEDNVGKMVTELGQRYDADRQIEGHMIGAIGGTEDTVVANHFSSPHMTILATGASETPAEEWAAALTGVIAANVEDPARPFNTLPIYGVKVPLDGQRFERAARSRLLDAGFSTYNVDFGDIPHVERLITTFKGVPGDESYLSINTLLTLSYIRFSFSSFFSSKYARSKLADDDAVIRPGSLVLTPSGAKAEALALFKAWEDRGLVEGFDQFKNDLVVERNKTDRSRLDFYLSPRLVSQLNIIGANVSFLI